MKIAFLISLFFLLGFTIQAQDEPQMPTSTSMDSLKTTVSKLINFYDSYEDGSSESSKEAKYNEAVDDMSEGTATQQDKNDAFKLIDAYIKADNAPTQSRPEREQTTIDNSSEVQEKAQEYVNEAENHLLSMSYTEYENYIFTSNSMASRREIKESYNKLHQNDGKSVSISASDDELTDTQKQVKAFEQLENATTYEEYKEAINVLNPSVSDEEIRKAWDDR